MTENFEFEISRPSAMYQQIANFFESEISSGNLKENDRLPSTTILAKKFKVNQETIQQSMKLLTQRGLIERTPGRGTFIRAGLAQKRVGIIFGSEIFTRQRLMFHAVFLEKLIEYICEDNWSYELYPTSDLARYDRAFHDLKHAVFDNELRAVIEFCSNDLVTDYLNKECNVPVSGAPVELDYQYMLDTGLAYLRKQGGKNIVIVRPQSGSYPFENLKFDTYADLNLQLIDLTREDSHAKVYQQILTFLQTHSEFDSVFVFEDSLYLPALFAIQAAGRQILQDCMLISHANKDVELFSPLPLTRLEIDPAKIAKQTWQALKAQIAGQKFVSHRHKVAVKAGKTCREK